MASFATIKGESCLLESSKSLDCKLFKNSEYIKQNINVDYSEVLNNLQSRDLDDSNRQDSPLIVANDAIEIDNSSMTIDEQLILVKNILKDKFNL
jgi:cytidylate kinase